MSRIGLLDDGVVYPTSDGQPMAETQIHGDCMMYVASALRWRFKKHGRDDVYVGSNNFLYYERGNPRAVVAPDVYVVMGAPTSPPRDTYMLWNEPKGPDFVLRRRARGARTSGASAMYMPRSGYGSTSSTTRGRSTWRRRCRAFGCTRGRTARCRR